ncbi:hypothetical protein ELQ39_07255 [Streptomyces sp. GB4-14]|nr:hypothetical protein [Streptomyces sp. GB4-14]
MPPKRRATPSRRAVSGGSHRGARLRPSRHRDPGALGTARASRAVQARLTSRRRPPRGCRGRDPPCRWARLTAALVGAGDVVALPALSVPHPHTTPDGSVAATARTAAAPEHFGQE